MARKAKGLTAVQVRQAPAGKYADGEGLWLVKADRETGSWVLRVVVHGRRREMGLGRIADVGLKEAREAARRWRSVVRQGIDPIHQRQREAREAARKRHLLKDIADEALKDDGKAGRWFSPLALHVLPKLGAVPVSNVDQIDIRDALAPIWHEKAETAEKALHRLSIVMKHAAALGLDVDLQATQKARALLGKQRHRTEHIPALPWQDVPAFYSSLDNGTVTHCALRLLILTGVRSGPLRHLREEHVDGDIWTIPAELLKGKLGSTSDFRVPLSPEAAGVIEQARRHARDGFMFPSVRKGVISDATMARLMERRGIEARPHGFRSSLRDWLAEETDAPREIAETILGHAAGGKVERSYRRTDYLDQRRDLLNRWARWVTNSSVDGVSATEVRKLPRTKAEL